MKEIDLVPEANLLQLVQVGDEQAFASLMRRYYRDLYNYGSKFSRDESLIKDCIQEVFISLWQRRETIHSILSPKYYFLRATKNKVLKALYKNMQNASLADLPQEYEFFHEFSVEYILIEKQMTDERAAKLKDALCLLSRKQKEIVYLKYYQYLDCSQIAELMSLNRQSVYNLLHETIQKLRNILKTDLVTQ
jgi:RNA polymerase sigma factor (sigma-70 family)